VKAKNVARYRDLKGKVAVVTGGPRGIAATTCGLLAENGTSVVVSGRDAEAIDEVVTGIITSGGRAAGAPADCTSLADLDRLRERTEEAFGPADILIAFAGVVLLNTRTKNISEEECSASSTRTSQAPS
jgi:3-oxoacyl-[acyl-carrier protein] reductase